MPYVKPIEKFQRVNFLASSKVQAFTYVVSDVGVTADANGKKIVKAGTILPKTMLPQKVSYIPMSM